MLAKSYKSLDASCTLLASFTGEGVIVSKICVLPQSHAEFRKRRRVNQGTQALKAGNMAGKGLAAGGPPLLSCGQDLQSLRLNGASSKSVIWRSGAEGEGSTGAFVARPRWD